MPARFDRLGITFLYPENWRLDEEEALQGHQSVTVYSPSGGAFWSVAIHPPSEDPAKLAAAALKVMQQEYEDLDSEAASETLGDREMVGYDMNFFCLDLTNSAVVRSLRTRQATYTIFYQAEDREFDQVQPVFQAITVSLLRGFKTEGIGD